MNNSFNYFRENLLLQPSVDSQQVCHLYRNWIEHQNHNSTIVKRIISSLTRLSNKELIDFNSPGLFNNASQNLDFPTSVPD